MSTSPSTLIVGIDLGTTYSCIAYVDEVGKPVVIPNQDNELVTPSVVYFETLENVIVGKVAKESARVYPDQVVELIKRDMGNPHFRRTIHGQEFRPEEISALILRKLKEDAERHLSRPVTDAVITVPAYFNEAQRTATEQAGRLAGFNVRGIIPEPTAAAIAYALTEAARQTVLVYDLGGGTFDVTVIEVGNNTVKVICINGDHDLGGRNWDEVLVGHFADVWRLQTGRSDDPLADPETTQDFLTKAESTKRSLTRMPKAAVRLGHEGETARLELARERFDELTSGLLQRTLALTKDTLGEAARKKAPQVECIILVGGSSYMPQVATALKERTALPWQLFDPEQAVAKGAALYAASKAIQDVYASVLQELFGRSDVNVDALPFGQRERVEAGVQRQLPGRAPAALEAARKARIINASSKSFGVVTLDSDDRDQVSYLIRKNSQTPAEVEETFGTRFPGQTEVNIRVIEAEGENPSTDPASPEVAEIKTFLLGKLPPGLPRGTPIMIKYHLSEDGGRLRVKATLKQTGESIEVTIDSVNALSQVELDELTRDLAKVAVKG